MVVISRFTGKEIDDYQHTIESLITIFSTPKRTRAYRRWFGEDILNLQDRAVTDSFKLEVYTMMASVAKAEPRFKLEKTELNVELSVNGEVYIDIYGFYMPDNKLIKLEGIRII